MEQHHYAFGQGQGHLGQGRVGSLCGFDGWMLLCLCRFTDLNMKRVQRVEMERSPSVNNFPQAQEARNSCELNVVS